MNPCFLKGNNYSFICKKMLSMSYSDEIKDTHTHTHIHTHTYLRAYTHTHRKRKTERESERERAWKKKKKKKKKNKKNKSGVFNEVSLPFLCVAELICFDIFLHLCFCRCLEVATFPWYIFFHSQFMCIYINIFQFVLNTHIQICHSYPFS